MAEINSIFSLPRVCVLSPELVLLLTVYGKDKKNVLHIYIKISTRPAFKTIHGGVETKWLARLISNRSVVSLSPIVSKSKKLYPHCLVLVGSRNGFERD